MSKKLTVKEFIERAQKVHGNKYDYSKSIFVDVDTKLEIICPIHGSFWMTPYHHISRKQNCPLCVGNKKLSTNDFVNRSIKVHGNKYDYSKSKYVSAHVPVEIVCLKYGSFWQQPNNHMRGAKCPICSNIGLSKGEKTIKNFLIQKGIIFEAQKRFDSCRNKNPLPFDFYLPNYNLCIEFQGRQHFEPIKMFGGDKALKETMLNDSIKKKWCSKPENPKLLEIKYNENIEEALKEHLDEVEN